MNDRRNLSHAERKERPLARGVLDYFPDALLEVALVSKVGNDQHNPGEEIHWAKEKSQDEADALLRHLIDRGKRDIDGMRHSAKVAWRALALLQREIDAERVSHTFTLGFPPPPADLPDGYIGLYREAHSGPMKIDVKVGKPEGPEYN